MKKVRICTIPAHVAYTQEYDVKDYNDFFDYDTGVNTLQNLSDQVDRENPDVTIPDIPDDYNYFTHAAGQPVVSPMHVRYYDMTDKKGKDTEDYTFVEVPEVTAAVTEHVGPFERVGETYAFLYKWIEDNGYEIAGDGRSSAVHGPWDCESPDDYTLEIQVPVVKA